MPFQFFVPPVRRRRRPSLLAGFSLAWGVFAAGCGSSPRTSPEAGPAAAQDPGAVVARFSGGEIQRGDIATAVERRLAALPQPVSAEQRRAIVRAIVERRVRSEVVYRDAVAMGVPDRPDVQTRIRGAQDRILANDWLEREVIAKTHATPSLVEEETARRLAVPREETRKFSHIYVKGAAGDARARARETMARIQAELAGGRPFAELAQEYSDSVTARGGGVVEWTRREPLHDRIADVVFSLGQGAVGGPIETETGLHLVQVDAIRTVAAADPVATRKDVQAQLDREAQQAAVEAERQRSFDALGVTLDAAALAAPGDPEKVLATVAGEPFRRIEFERIRRNGLGDPGLSTVDAARARIVDRVLAARRRQSPIDATLQRRLDGARHDVIVSARREEMASAIPAAVADDEVRKRYLADRDTQGLLRELVFDVLFLPQTGDDSASVYGAGQAVSARLRSGESFDKVLAAPGGPAGTVARRRVAGAQRETFAQQSPRAAKAIADLKPGQVSEPIYVQGERITFGQPQPFFSGRGLMFLRLVEERALPFERVKRDLAARIANEKRAAGILAIQGEVDRRAALAILLPEG